MHHAEAYSSVGIYERRIALGYNRMLGSPERAARGGCLVYRGGAAARSGFDFRVRYVAMY
jgi:hypothetical protein